MDNIQEEINYMPQIIGVAGTLFGVILGWVLSYFSGHVGGIKIYIDSAEYRRSQSGECAYILKLLIYNTSQQPKYIRKLRIIFYNSKNNESFYSTPYIGTCTFENIGNKTKNPVSTNGVSLSGKASTEITLSGIIQDKNNWHNTTRVYLSYKYKNKTKKSVISKKFISPEIKEIEYNKFP